MNSVLFVVSEVGYSWEEVILPYIEFKKKDFTIVIATPQGSVPKPDPKSIAIRQVTSQLGLGISKNLSPDSEVGRKLSKMLEKSVALSGVEQKDFGAIYIAGGHGSLFDLNKNKLLHSLILDFYHTGKPVGILCHASSTLAFIKDNEKPFLENKNITGFPTIWEYGALLTHNVSKTFLPIPIWTGKELDKHATGRTFMTRILEVINPYYVTEDKNIISGVGPKTGGILAQKIISLLF